MRIHRRSQSGEIIAPFESGQQAAPGVTFGNPRHEAGQVAVSASVKPMLANGSSRWASKPAEMMTNSA